MWLGPPLRSVVTKSQRSLRGGAGVSGHYLIVLTLSVFLLKRALLCSYLLNPRDDQDLIRLPQINGSKW